MKRQQNGKQTGGSEKSKIANPRATLVAACLITSTGLSFVSAHASAATGSDNEFARIAKLVKLPYPVTVTNEGELHADKSKWSTSKESDGTELLTSTVKEPMESRVAVIRTKSVIESFTSYTLKAAGTGSGTKPESSSSVFFDQGKLAAFTICEDSGGKDSLGRTCVTATPKLCQNLKSSDPIEADTMSKVDSFEMRAIATILTLRGPDHQLDNVVRTGNRLGLKSALQTTKGQLVALSKQVSKELEAQQAAAPSRQPANVASASGAAAAPAAALKTVASEKKIVASADTSHAALEEEAKTRTQLEHTIPMLQQACADTGFLK